MPLEALPMGSWIFIASTYVLSARYRYNRCSGSSEANVKIIADKDCSVLDLVSDPRCRALRSYAPSYLSAVDVHGVLASSAPAVVRFIFKLFASRVKYSRQVLTTEDGGTIALDYAELTDKAVQAMDSAAPVVVIHHGLCGDSQSNYVIFTAEHLLTRGYRVVVFIARGCGGLRLTTNCAFNASRLHDMELAVETVRSKYTDAVAIFGMGYSLGAGIMLNYLSKSTSCLLDGAVCVSPPWNLMVATAVFPLFSPLLALSLKVYALLHFEHLIKDLTDLRKLLFSWTLYQLESLFLHMHGYSSVEEYYVDASAAYSSHKITVPTLAVSAMDDPVCCHTASNLNYLGPGLAVVKTLTGGHLGFMEDTVSKYSWTDKVACEWFDVLLAKQLGRGRELADDSSGTDGVRGQLPTSLIHLPVHASETMAVWSEAAGDVVLERVVCLQTTGRQPTALTVSSGSNPRVRDLHIAYTQFFRVEELPHTPMSSPVSAWSMGVLELPPLGVKVEVTESAGDNHIFYITSCDCACLELALSPPTTHEWNDLDAQRVLLSEGDSFHVPPRNIYRLQNHSYERSCKLLWTVVKSCAAE